MKLISMVDLILNIDWLTTSEFCNAYGLPHPTFTGNVEKAVSELITIDAIKHRYFVEYAKLLNKDLQLDMFIGNNPPLFHNWQEIDARGGYRTFTLSRRYNITNDQYGFKLQPHDSVDGKRLAKVGDLIGLGLEINFKLK